MLLPPLSVDGSFPYWFSPLRISLGEIEMISTCSCLLSPNYQTKTRGFVSSDNITLSWDRDGFKGRLKPEDLSKTPI